MPKLDNYFRPLPEADRALEIIQEAKAIRQRIASLVEVMQEPRGDLRTWLQKQLSQLADEETRSRLQRTASIS